VPAPNIGYNAASKEYEDLLEAGVLDPARVTRSALINAASISGLMLTTDVMITKIDEEEHGAKIQGAVR
jgi:chaperonin GroEL